MMEGRLQDGPVAALATPLGTSALGVIRLSGEGCLALLAERFSSPRKLREAQGHTMVVGRIVEEGRLLDEVVVSVYRAPRSYTGEEMAEISCHGSVPGIRSILDCLFAAGFRQAHPGEFTLRAFLNGKLDLSRAEAVHEIITSRTREAQAQALRRLEGGVERAVNQVKSGLVDLMAQVSAQLDYPEEEVEEVSLDPAVVAGHRKRLESLAATHASGLLYQEGVRVALAGRTNAGKSRLFNALVREERAIVSEVHGTTRDWLEAPFSLKGIPVRLFDTAGLREGAGEVEREGIRRTGLVLEGASLILYLVDGTRGMDEGEPGVLEELAARGVPVLVLWTKSDLGGWSAPPDSAWSRLLARPPMRMSSAEHAGIAELLDVMAELVTPGRDAEEAGVLIESERQYRLLLGAAEALEHVEAGIEAGYSLDLVGLDLQEALQCLGQITGEVRTEDILDRVFSTFCLGK